MATQSNRLIFPGLAAFYASVGPITYTLVRVFTGVIMIMHGLPKWNAGAERIGTAFANNYGLPRGLAYAAIFLELVGGAALVVGLFTRFFAAALAIEMLIAMFAAHWTQGFILSVAQQRNGYEFVCLLGLVFLAIAIRGGGPYSVDAKLPKEL